MKWLVKIYDSDGDGEEPLSEEECDADDAGDALAFVDTAALTGLEGRCHVTLEPRL